jgi:hypothetical protein
MNSSEVLWQDGRFRCELQTQGRHVFLSVSESERSIIELTIGSRTEAAEQAMALRLLVHNHLDGIRWISV